MGSLQLAAKAPLDQVWFQGEEEEEMNAFLLMTPICRNLLFPVDSQGDENSTVILKSLQWPRPTEQI